jgi:hypothetical protein
VRQSARKLWGTVAILVLLVAYPLAVMEIYARNFMALPWWGALVVLAIAGVLWFWPASILIRWMSKPDASP